VEPLQTLILKVAKNTFFSCSGTIGKQRRSGRGFRGGRIGQKGEVVVVHGADNLF
jgi:hypothetical protein